MPAAAGRTPVDDFIERAPDAKPAPPEPERTRWQRGNKTQITFSLDPDLLERIDRSARKQSLSRAAWLIVASNERLDREAGR